MAARQERFKIGSSLFDRIDWDRAVSDETPIGEVPAVEVPGMLITELPMGKKGKGDKPQTEKERLAEAKKRGPFRTFVRGLRKEGRHVTVAGLRGATEAILFVASSKAVVGYLPRLHSSRKKK